MSGSIYFEMKLLEDLGHLFCFEIVCDRIGTNFVLNCWKTWVTYSVLKLFVTTYSVLKFIKYFFILFCFEIVCDHLFWFEITMTG